MQIKKKGKQTLMFHNRKDIILFWIIFMGRTEALYNSQPINENGGEGAILLPDGNAAEPIATKADDAKPTQQNPASRSENKTKHHDKKH
jgi:hypothetical protein